MHPQAEEFCCPACKGPLNFCQDEYSCAGCDKKYPVILGIPDFRVFPDPYIDYEDDRNKAKYLVQHYDTLDFMGLVRLYWKITPEVSEDRAERFIRRTVALVEKGLACLNLIESLADNTTLQKSSRILEIGCGTGGFLVAARRQYENVVGADIAFRWLIIARKRLHECGMEVPLVCCCAEYLPFRDKRFDIILAEAVIEHVRSQEGTLNESHRVMTDDGMIFLATPNRFSITTEPHVHVWGVGFLPRKWMHAYVKMIKGINYKNIRVMSFMELRRLLKKCRFDKHLILLPSISSEEAKHFSAGQRFQLRIYNAVKRIPIVRSMLYFIGPCFNVVAFANKQ